MIFDVLKQGLCLDNIDNVVRVTILIPSNPYCIIDSEFNDIKSFC